MSFHNIGWLIDSVLQASIPPCKVYFKNTIVMVNKIIVSHTCHNNKQKKLFYIRISRVIFEFVVFLIFKKNWRNYDCIMYNSLEKALWCFPDSKKWRDKSPTQCLHKSHFSSWPLHTIAAIGRSTQLAESACDPNYYNLIANYTFSSLSSKIVFLWLGRAGGKRVSWRKCLKQPVMSNQVSRFQTVFCA